MVHYMLAWLNNFPPMGRISQMASPWLIVTGTKLMADRHCHIPFGAYAQVHKENDPTNMFKLRTIGAVALGASGNAKGTVYFLNLNTGQIVELETFYGTPSTR